VSIFNAIDGYLDEFGHCNDPKRGSGSACRDSCSSVCPAGKEKARRLPGFSVTLSP
jgi:hypothetical protein